MMINPDSITYYFKNGTEPFLSKSEYSDKQMLTVMNTHFSGDTRFHKNPLDNIRRRRNTEKWLHEEFKRQGGKPKIRHPRYFVLGNSSYLAEYPGFNGDFTTIEIPLHEINKLEISFTYPDSVVSRWLAEASGNNYYNSAYHGRLFMLDDIRKLLETYRITGEEWRKNPNRKYDFFIEAQVWTLEPLMKYKTEWNNSLNNIASGTS